MRSYVSCKIMALFLETAADPFYVYLVGLNESCKSEDYAKKKICIGIVFDFSWAIFMSQEKLQTIVVQKFWGVLKVYYGIVQVVN